MGGKQARTWQQICFCLALLVCLAGCIAMADQARQRESYEQLASGDRLMETGDFDGSLRALFRVTELALDQAPADEAWFKMGLIHLHPGNPRKDREQAIGSFTRVFSVFPASVYAAQARIWVSVLREAEQSSRDLSQSREILEASRQDAERAHQALEKSQLEVEKSRQEVERTKQILEKSRQVDIEIEEKRRVRGR